VNRERGHELYVTPWGLVSPGCYAWRLTDWPTMDDELWQYLVPDAYFRWSCLLPIEV
jgi:hypothetical protein